MKFKFSYFNILNESTHLLLPLLQGDDIKSMELEMEKKKVEIALVCILSTINMISCENSNKIR